MPIRFTALIAPDAMDASAPRSVMAKARLAEERGFDIASYADFVSGDVFPALTLMAQATERIGLLSRIVCAFTRSAPLLASGAAWVSQASGGRFMLGLGPSLRDAVEERHGVPFGPAAQRMRDIVGLIRALWGEDVPGASRNANGSIRYHSGTLETLAATVDLLPSGRPPILIAAGGPLMLRTAGAVADGVVLEMVSPAAVRWSLDRVREGAEAAGRSLQNFTVCVQGTFVYEAAGRRELPGTLGNLSFYHFHLQEKSWQPMWRAAGLGAEAEAVQRLVAAGRIAESEQLVLERVLPEVAVYPNEAGSFSRWLDGLAAAGANLIALPLECERLLGVTVADCRAQVAGLG